MMRIFFGLLCVSTLFLTYCQPAEPPAEEVEAVEETEAAEEAAPAADRGVVDATVGNAHITIDYGRPALKGRDMLTQLEEGEVWRLGMNEATTIEADQDLLFGDTRIAAGKYSMFAKKVSAEQWHLIFNSEAGIWGTARKAENDVAEVPAEVNELGESVEQFLIEVVSTGDTSGEIVMKWATLELRVPFTTG